MRDDNLYIAGVHDTEDRGPFAVICSSYIDGNLADVYGETTEEASRTALGIIDAISQVKNTADDYQAAAARTLIDRPDFVLTNEEVMLIWNAIGVAGEAGEVCDSIKKMVFHRHGLDKDKLTKELGDLMWYIAGLCTKLGVNLSDVMTQNITKLKERYPDGYSSEASLRRVDVR